MSLNTFLLRAAFGSEQIPDGYTFVLLRAGKPVQGYTPPMVARGKWRLRDHGVSTLVTFGPAQVPLVFDQVELRADGVSVDVTDVGEVSLPPGMAFEYEATFDIAEA